MRMMLQQSPIRMFHQALQRMTYKALDLLATGTIGKTSVTLTDNTSNQVVYSVSTGTATVLRFKYSLKTNSK